MAERMEASDEVKAQFKQAVYGAKVGMDNKTRILGANFYWLVMAILKGVQRKNEREGVYWKTSLDKTLDELATAKTIDTPLAQDAQLSADRKEFIEIVKGAKEPYKAGRAVDTWIDVERRWYNKGFEACRESILKEVE